MIKRLFSADPLWQNNGIAFLRISVGLMLIYHGKEVFDKQLMQGYATWDQFKQFSNPAFMAYLGKSSELIAGILLTAGLFTRLAAIIVVATFLYITFLVGTGKFWYEDQHPFMFVIVGLFLFFTGAGSYSMDKRFFGYSSIR